MLLHSNQRRPSIKFTEWVPSRSFICSSLPLRHVSAAAMPFLSLANKLYVPQPPLCSTSSVTPPPSMDGDTHHKRPSAEPDANDIVKRPRTPEPHAAGDDDVLAWLLMQEGGSEAELFNLLDPDNHTFEAAGSSLGMGKVRFIDDPYSSLLVFQSSSSYVTINGNEESCGSSFSDSGTSVMASIDMSSLNTAGRPTLVKAEERSASASTEEATREEGSVSGCGEGMDGCDGLDWDDEVLARFLGEDENLFSEEH